MNKETAQRLVELRKQHGLSQEALAERLYVSRQAVSKWERGEASPDTDNLIALARLYGISLDELLGVCIKEEQQGGEQRDESEAHTRVYISNGCIKCYKGDKETRVDVADGHITVNKDGETTEVIGKPESYLRRIPVPIIITIIYLALGFAAELWHPGWIVFLMIPVIDSVITCIIRKSIRHFCYPVFITAVFLLLGCTVQGAWGWSWILLLTVPVFYSVARLFKRSDREDEDDDEDEQECDD